MSGDVLCECCGQRAPGRTYPVDDGEDYLDFCDRCAQALTPQVADGLARERRAAGDHDSPR